MIVGTAGHVDHGKTSLVRALTGVDTDRLAEEKRRGISIELGFAYARLDDDATREPIGFVDVPGHRRFVQTMIAGAAGIDVALLVVAADDGPMPQTREHLDILRWLGVARLVVAVTKVEAVEPARVNAVAAELAALLDDTPWRGAPIARVSVVAGLGLDALKTTLLALRDVPSTRVDSRAPFRLAIDRAFVLNGIGLVVTGTAVAGHVAVDDTLTLLPSRLAVRVRGIHAQNEAVTAAHAGQRIALNVVGRGVEQGVVHRGDWIVAPAVAITTDRIDVVLDGDGDPIDARAWRHVRFHVGATSTNARAMLLVDRIAQIAFDEPVHLVAGDRFVLRGASAAASAADTAGSIAGGVVLAVDVPTRGRRSASRLAYLATAAAGDPRSTLAHGLSISPKGIDLARWNATHGTTFAQVDVGQSHAVVSGSQVTLFAETVWATMQARTIAVLAAEHAAMPDAVGPGRDRLRRMAAPAWDAPTFGALVDVLKADGRIAQTGAWLHLPDHRVALSIDDRRRFDAARDLLEPPDAPNAPPRIRDLARALADDEVALRGAFVRLAARGELYRVAHDHFFLPATVHRLARTVADLAAVDGVAKAAPFRDRIGGGRKVAIQILEFFDRVGYTRRIGDDHRIIQPTLFADAVDTAEPVDPAEPSPTRDF